MAPTTSRLASLLLLAAAALVPLAQAADTCYLPSGDEAPGGIVPCRTTSGHNNTHCCGGSDYCLSNGLCLNAGGSNEITQQGCTGKNWDDGCHKYCPDSDINTGDNYLYLIYCVTLNSTSAGYCCGTDRSCCSVTEDLISIALFSEAIHPTDIKATTSGTSPSSSSTKSVTSQTPASSTSNSGADLSDSSSGSPNDTAAADSQDSGVTGRVVGLALGLSLGAFGMIVACVWMYLRYRRQRDQQARQLGAAAAVPRNRGSGTSGDGNLGRMESDAEMLSIEYKEPVSATATTAVSPSTLKSPPPRLQDRRPHVTSSGSNPPGTPGGTSVSGTLPPYASGARGYYDPEKPVPPTPSEAGGISAGNAAYETHIQEQEVQHHPQAAELHGQHAAYEMSSEPVGSPQELEGGSSTRSVRPPLGGLGNHKYRF